jgi:hypothetical protein
MKQSGANVAANFFIGIIPQGGKAPITLSVLLVQITGAWGFDLTRSSTYRSLKNSIMHCSIIS